MIDKHKIATLFTDEIQDVTENGEKILVAAGGKETLLN
ncbi:MAG: 4Fe-4S ferredoxin, partial [Deltaproteobacteria bacterium]|nr:4Fe-4S ferredoxin [Deltaproteobacteria bacterium]